MITSFLKHSLLMISMAAFLKEKKITFYLETPLHNKPIYQYPSLSIQISELF